jgi:hypothetical protein
MASDIVGYAAEQNPFQALATMGAKDNQIGTPLSGNTQPLSGGRPPAWR